MVIPLVIYAICTGIAGDERPTVFRDWVAPLAIYRNYRVGYLRPWRSRCHSDLGHNASLLWSHRPGRGSANRQPISQDSAQTEITMSEITKDFLYCTLGTTLSLGFILGICVLSLLKVI